MNNGVVALEAKPTVSGSKASQKDRSEVTGSLTLMGAGGQARLPQGDTRTDSYEWWGNRYRRVKWQIIQQVKSTHRSCDTELMAHTRPTSPGPPKALGFAICTACNSDSSCLPRGILNSEGNTIYFVDSYYLLMTISSERLFMGIKLNILQLLLVSKKVYIHI